MKLLFFVLFLIVNLNAHVNVVCKAGIMDNIQAKKYINNLLKDEPKNIVCILKLANIHLKSGDLLKGYKLIARAYKINPKGVEQSSVSSILPYALEMSELARKAKKNNDPMLWNQIAANLFEMGVYAEAIKAYNKSLSIDKNQPKIRLQLALNYNKNNQIDESVDQLFTLVEQNENDFYANYYLGKILRYSITDEDSAVKYFKNAKKILENTKDQFQQREYSIFINDINQELGK